MEWYLRKKHKQFQDWREIMLPKFLKCVLVFLIGIVIGEIVAEPFTRTRTVFFENITKVEAVQASSSVVSEDKATAEAVAGVEVKASIPVSEIEKNICEKWGDDCKIAIAVMKAESQGDPTRIGDKHLTFEKDGRNYGASYGLFQLRDLPGRFENPKEMLNPKKNIDYAFKMYQSQGWKPWSAYTNKSYLKYL